MAFRKKSATPPPPPPPPRTLFEKIWDGHVVDPLPEDVVRGFRGIVEARRAEVPAA